MYFRHNSQFANYFSRRYARIGEEIQMGLFSRLFRKPVIVIRFPEDVTQDFADTTTNIVRRTFPDDKVIAVGRDLRIAIDGTEILPPSRKPQPINFEFGQLKFPDFDSTSVEHRQIVDEWKHNRDPKLDGTTLAKFLSLKKKAKRK